MHFNWIYLYQKVKIAIIMSLRKRRIITAIIEFYIISIIGFISWKVFSGLFEKPVFITLITLFFFVLKDSFVDGSIVKAFFGIKIVRSKTKTTSSISQRLVRNFSILIWPLELFMILIKPNKRLGDLLVGTEIIKSEKISLRNYHMGFKTRFELITLLKAVVILAAFISVAYFYISFLIG